MQIPFVDLHAQYRSLKREIDDAIEAVVNETAFIGGIFVENFEKAFAEAYDVKHCISVANGTDAIYISMKALGIGPGDEVITVANSWISTSEAISQTGAKTVFVDIDKDYYTIDTNRIEEKITKRTKAVLPVHLYGQPAAIDEIARICDLHDLFLIEDCAQAHFAAYKGKKVGTFGVAGAFSFYPGKNLGAYGDAGVIVSDHEDFAARARMFANHGALRKHEHEIEGINSRMDGIQAAILSVKLPHVEEWNQKRLGNAQLYTELLADIPYLEVPKIQKDSDHIFHLYVIRTERRDELRQFLMTQGITTGVHYPTALPFLPAYQYLRHKPEDFPIAYENQNKILSLPMYPELTYDMIEYVAERIQAFLL